MKDSPSQVSIENSMSAKDCFDSSSILMRAEYFSLLGFDEPIEYGSANQRIRLESAWNADTSGVVGIDESCL